MPNPQHTLYNHNAYQRHYFETVERKRIQPVSTVYVARQIERMVRIAALCPEHSILEVGCGLGKYSLPLLQRGYTLTCLDLSPALLKRLSNVAPELPTLCCDVAEVDRYASPGFERVIGFFVLHHLIDLERAFHALSRILKPGGRVAFCEPVAWNPLYYLQIAVTPGMTFKGERNLWNMRPTKVFPALRQAGFRDCAVARFGFFPPFITNTAIGPPLENWLEQRWWTPFPHAFQIFSARLLNQP